MRAKTLATVLALILMVGAGFGYTDATRPVYIDYTLMGATTATGVGSPSNIYDVPGGYAIIMDTIHMDSSLQCDTLTLTSSTPVYDPLIYPLNGTVTLIVGIPQAPGSTTYLKYFTPGDSYGVQVPGKLRSFIIWKDGTADSVEATGYVVLGRVGVPTTNMHLK